MDLDDETILILAGGALLVGLLVRHKIMSAAAGEPIPSTASGYATPATGGATYQPPAGAATPTTPTTPTTPPATNTADPAAEAAFWSDARAMQEDYYNQQVADLKARVASGALVPGTPDYESHLRYVANIRGGVATLDSELAKLAAQGLSGPRGGRRLRLVR